MHVIFFTIHYYSVYLIYYRKFHEFWGDKNFSGFLFNYLIIWKFKGRGLVSLQRTGVGVWYQLWGLANIQNQVSFIPNSRFINTFLTKHIIKFVNILREDSNLNFFKNLIILFFRMWLGVPKHRMFRNNRTILSNNFWKIEKIFKISYSNSNFPQHFLVFFFRKPELPVTQVLAYE